jgi:arsenical resistance protein ArsH
MSCCTPKTPQAVCCAPKPELAADAPCCGAEVPRKDRVIRVRALPDPDYLPALDPSYAIERPALDLGPLNHPPRILLLYGSLRDVSYSRAAVEEAARLLRFFGAEPRIFDPSDLPFPDQVKGNDHPAVHELRELSIWSEGQVWCSPERHGQITGLMKAQIDHLPLALGGVRPTQGRTLAVMQVSGGSQSFNAVNMLRLLGRWMRMVTIPNQSSVAKAYAEFEGGRMKPSAYYDRIVDVMKELMRFTVLTRPHVAQLTDRYSERKEDAAKLEARTNISSI